jgi:hypothetical protein
LSRLGTCGGIAARASTGTISVASSGACFVGRNYDAFGHNYSDENGTERTDTEPYFISKVAPAHGKLSQSIVSALSDALGSENVVEGLLNKNKFSCGPCFHRSFALRIAFTCLCILITRCECDL